MKIRAIIIIFALIAFLTTSIGGYLYYFNMKKTAVRELSKETDTRIDEISNRLDLYLSGNQKIAVTLAGIKELQKALESDRPDVLQDAVAEKVAFVPGSPFFSKGGGENTMRLNFSNAPPAKIREGMARLGRVLQRRMGVGFSRAGKLIDMMSRDGLLGPPRGSKPREVLVAEDYFEEVDRQPR